MNIPFSSPFERV